MEREMLKDRRMFERPSWSQKRFLGWFFLHKIRNRYFIDRGREQMMFTLCFARRFFTLGDYKKAIENIPRIYTCDYSQESEIVFLMIQYKMRGAEYIDDKSFGEKLHEIIVWLEQNFPDVVEFTNTVQEFHGSGAYYKAIYLWWYYGDENTLFTIITLPRSLLPPQNLYKVPLEVFSYDNFTVEETCYPRDGMTLKYKLIGHGTPGNTQQTKNRIERLIDRLISSFV